jgi:Uri superfamily endonuclease
MKTNPFEGLAKGTYILFLHLSRKRKGRVGKLGELTFIPGYYAYVGSALGPGGLAARLHHHLKTTIKPRWHIDYLRGITTLKTVWYTESDVRLEHSWAFLLARMANYAVSFPGFGSSDCRCKSHLFYFSRIPLTSEFTAAQIPFK